jgi:hypothetical protein
MGLQELKHVDPAYLQRSTRVFPPVFEVNSNPLHLNPSEWPELPKVPGFEKPTTIRAAVTMTALKLLDDEIREEDDALSHKIYRRSEPTDFIIHTTTEIWVARLRDRY